MKGLMSGISAVAAISLALSCAPVLASHASKSAINKEKKAIIKQALGHQSYDGIGSFTPASADPRLAQAFAHTGVMNTGFRFTPSSGTIRLGHGITVAVRARSTENQQAGAIHLTQITTNLSPTAYNLGLAVGWRKFALSGDYSKSDLGLIDGGRESESVGISYNARKWSSRLSFATEHPISGAVHGIDQAENVSVDLGSSYRLSRNFDVTAGLRYKREHDWANPLVDTRRDSQAVYVGTQFRF